MPVLCDTNILIRLSKPDHDQHLVTLAAVTELHAHDERLVTVPQCCYEYYVVATRPTEQNGLGLSPAEAMANLDELLTLLRLMRDERSVFGWWRSVVLKGDVHGKPAHDARIVAAMHRHGVRRLLTANGRDFRRYAGVEILTPDDIAQSS